MGGREGRCFGFLFRDQVKRQRIVTLQDQHKERLHQPRLWVVGVFFCRISEKRDSVCIPSVLSFNVTKAFYPLNQAKCVCRIFSALVRNRQDETKRR